MQVDLSKCKEGERLILRDTGLGTYVGPDESPGIHKVKPDGVTWVIYYAQDGRAQPDLETSADVVKTETMYRAEMAEYIREVINPGRRSAGVGDIEGEELQKCVDIMAGFHLRKR